MSRLPKSFFFASAAEQAERIRNKSLSPVDVMQATLERIDRINPALNAFVSLRPPDDLLAEAREVEDRLARGDSVGPLAGLPLGVKDLEDAVGLPNTHGSLLFKDAPHPQRDTIQVERLKRAGAIVLGKTNAPEAGYTAFTSNRVYGTTCNPWNPELTPGGSSGGSSAAVAAGLVALATASDGGGSVRIPAAYTGLFGLKPTQGRIPWGPEDSIRMTHCVVSGPLTRTVRDAALWLDVTVGPHFADPFSLPHPGLSYQEVIERPPPSLRIGVTPTLGYARCERQVLREFEEALGALGDCGHRIEHTDFGIEDIVVDWALFMAAEDYGFIKPHLHDESLLDPGYAPGLQIARKLTAGDLGDIQRRRKHLVAKLETYFSEFDLLATPTVTTVAFPAAGPIPTMIDGEPVRTPGGGIAFTYPFNFSGNPAVSLRAGMSDDGLPVGLQLVAPRLREDLLLQVSRQYEVARPWKDAWPSVD